MEDHVFPFRIKTGNYHHGTWLISAGILFVKWVIPDRKHIISWFCLTFSHKVTSMVTLAQEQSLCFFSLDAAIEPPMPEKDIGIKSLTEK